MIKLTCEYHSSGTVLSMVNICGRNCGPRKKPGPDRTRLDGCEHSHFLCVGSHVTFAVDDGEKKTLYLFAVWLASDRSSGFIFAVDELGESSLASMTL